MKKIILFFLFYLSALFGQNVVNLSPLSTSIETRKRIQAAEDSLSQNGGGIIYFLGLPSTIFHVDSTINKRSNVNWDGYATIMQDPEIKSALIAIYNRSDIIFNNLTFNGGGTGKKITDAIMINIQGNCHDICFQNVKFDNFKYSAVNIRGVGNDLTRSDSTRNISFDKCRFDCDPRINYIPLYIGGCENLTVSNCTFYNPNFSAIEFAGGYNKYAQIINNRFYMGPLGHWFIEADGVIEHAIINGNQSVCSPTSGGGISIHTRNSTIADNHIIAGTTGVDRSGMELSAANTDIHDNIIDNGGIYLSNDGVDAVTLEYSGVRSSYDTVFCHHNNIHDNIIKSIGGYCILLYYDDPVTPPWDTLNNIKIHDNILKSNNIAIYLGNTDSRSKMAYLEIYNNTISTDSGSSVNATGIKLQAPWGSHDIQIRDNTITNYAYGFIADSANYRNLVVEKNNFTKTSYPVYSRRALSSIIDRENYKANFAETTGGIATIGEGDSVRVKINGLTTSGIVVVSYKSGAALGALIKPPGWAVYSPNILTIYGKAANIVSYAIIKY